ncbi:MAG: cellulase family glycosylhydrolase, partial [Actinomycetota bacterium]
MRRVLAVALALLALAVPGPATSAAPRRGIPVRPLDPRTLPLGHEGRWFTDAHGRVVILHGVNMVAKLPPYDPGEMGFSADDARFLASEGFNTVRLGLIYKGLEPERGKYRRDYLERIARLARMLGRHGIHVLADFHQDLFNERFHGEGFPDWAVIDDGLPNQPDLGFPGNYFAMPALWRAFDHFWANDPGPDGVGLQDAYAQAWKVAATRLRREPAVFGYDLLNEAWPGSQYPTCINPIGCPLFEASLGPFYERVIDQIRTVDRRKLVFYETHPVFGSGTMTFMPDTGDERAGFSWHMYCLGSTVGIPGGILGPAACPLGVDRPYQQANAHSEATGDALLLSEFGATDALDEIARDVEAADRHMMSWQYWSYFGRDPSGERPMEGIVHDIRRPPAGDNLKQEKLDVLVRAYPQAVAGIPLSWSFEHAAADRVFELSYTTDPSIRAPTDVVLPPRHYPHGYAVEVTGPARVVSAPGAPILKLRTTGPGP